MKKYIIIISLFVILSFVAFYIKQNSISKSNLELLVVFQSRNIYIEYFKDIEKAKKELDENLFGVKYIKENYEDKYGSNLINLKVVVEEDIKKEYFIIYENKYFRQMLYSSLFIFWLSISLYLYRKQLIFKP
jgi:hypothetical protein